MAETKERAEARKALMAAGYQGERLEKALNALEPETAGLKVEINAAGFKYGDVSLGKVQPNGYTKNGWGGLKGHQIPEAIRLLQGAYDKLVKDGRVIVEEEKASK